MTASCLRPAPLGASGIEVSGMSLGSWRTYERLDEATGIAIMRAARDEGITFFDDARYNDETGTAPLRTGYSEVVFGNLFRGAGLRREEVVVANKLWWEFWPGQDASAELDASLDRMGFDYIDLIYANAPPSGMDVAELVEQTAGLVAAGKARAWALVNVSAEVVSQAADAAAELAVAAPCTVQLPYSLVQRSWVEDPAMTAGLAKAAAGVVASFSLAGGVLSGKYLAGPASGRAAGTLSEGRVAPAAAAAAELAGLARMLDTTAAALALAFALAGPQVASVLFGATSPGQLRANCAAVGLLDRLSDGDLADLRRIGTAR